MNDYAPYFLSASDHLKMAWEQTALGNIGMALAHLVSARVGIDKMHESLVELQERQRQRAM